jgi:predicted  nucleic acid-binding Zn-ribbon protein
MKGVSEISGLRSIKSMHSSGKRSIPRVQSSAYLDLYMLRKEKDRLEKEIYILDKRKKDILKKLDDINKEMDKLQKQEAETKEKVLQEFVKPSEKEWKTMKLKY